MGDGWTSRGAFCCRSGLWLPCPLKLAARDKLLFVTRMSKALRSGAGTFRPPPVPQTSLEQGGLLPASLHRHEA